MTNASPIPPSPPPQIHHQIYQIRTRIRLRLRTNRPSGLRQNPGSSTTSPNPLISSSSAPNTPTSPLSPFSPALATSTALLTPKRIQYHVAVPVLRDACHSKNPFTFGCQSTGHNIGGHMYVLRPHMILHKILELCFSLDISPKNYLDRARISRKNTSWKLQKLIRRPFKL
ncbi:hypothetical protein IEQ34_015433 [Dendrobium chrysotoxum]|uniref:Uncharacterized protein n=1 Tax=Dendrobium chrysotoxum TaxID=161865 RepID=A0AAV7GFX8_DENCH|nr:hypothetical protein IEQ34_015433 [Dendrobium chrysotoxum]